MLQKKKKRICSRNHNINTYKVVEFVKKQTKDHFYSLHEEINEDPTQKYKIKFVKKSNLK